MAAATGAFFVSAGPAQAADSSSVTQCAPTSTVTPTDVRATAGGECAATSGVGDQGAGAVTSTEETPSGTTGVVRSGTPATGGQAPTTVTPPSTTGTDKNKDDTRTTGADTNKADTDKADTDKADTDKDCDDHSDKDGSHTTKDDSDKTVVPSTVTSSPSTGTSATDTDNNKDDTKTTGEDKDDHKGDRDKDCDQEKPKPPKPPVHKPPVHKPPVLTPPPVHHGPPVGEVGTPVTPVGASGPIPTSVSAGEHTTPAWEVPIGVALAALGAGGLGVGAYRRRVHDR